MLRLGYKASAEQFAPAELLRYGVLAEENGFDSVFTSDHFQPWRHDGGHAPFALSWLGALGARTERVLIGTSVLTPTFRYHPAVIAQAFATLGCLFPGRVVLGMGTGESMNEAPLGLVWPEGKVRFARFREAVTLIRKLWTEQRVTFDGEYYHTDRATIYDVPEQPVPLWLAGSGPAATRYAGRVGDGYITTSGKDPKLYIPVYIAHGNNDKVIRWQAPQIFYKNVRALRPGYPIRFVVFDGGTHGTPMRMTDWRGVLNWMLSLRG